MRKQADMTKRELFINAFCNYGEHVIAPPETIAAFEIYVCALYGKPKQQKVDDVRYIIFQQHYAPKKDGDLLE